MSLNSAQQEAVAYCEGPCLVLAGAGSGKTRVITQKIVHLMNEHHYPPQHIAALTFTNKAASEMRERILKLTQNKKLSNKLTICTFHALGLQILRQEAEHIGLKKNFSIFDSEDNFKLLQDFLSVNDKPLIRRLQQQISLWKNALLNPKMALQNAKNEDELQAARLYLKYSDTLRAYQAVDFDDLINLPLQLFTQFDQVRHTWQARLRYLLIDEYQDTNPCQYQLIKLLTTGPGKKALFTAVGDDDQAIYAWRGASLENLAMLQKDFHDLKLIKLEQNYRSTTTILNAANRLIKNNPKLFEKVLWSEHGIGEAINTIVSDHEEAEAEQIVMTLAAHKFEKRAQFLDYAILYRGNHQARVFEQILRRENIPYKVSGGQSFFERAEIKDIISYLRLIANPDDDPAFIRAVTTPKRGVGTATLEKLAEVAGKWKCSLFEALFKGSTEVEINEKQLSPLREFGQFINQMTSRASREPAGVLLDELLEAIGYQSYLYDLYDTAQAQYKWQHVADFIDWLKRKAEGDAENFVASKNLLELTQMVALMSMLEGREQNADVLTLSTLHAAKGLEFGHVFMVGVEEGILPHHGNASDETPADAEETRIEEERRLMYVGITRAKRSLHLSWCRKRKRSGEYIHVEPSRFIHEIDLIKAQENVEHTPAMTPQHRLSQLKELLKSRPDSALSLK